MPSVNKLPQAREDLLEIWRYIAQDNPRQADRFLLKLEERMELLALMPKSAPVSRWHKRLRCCTYERYLLFYLPLPDGIEIIRILHGASDIPTEFSA